MFFCPLKFEDENGEDSLSEIDNTNGGENGDDGDDDDDVDDEMAEILKDPDFANMSDSDKDDLPLFGEKDSDDSDGGFDFEEEEEKERRREVRISKCFSPAIILFGPTSAEVAVES